MKPFTRKLFPFAAVSIALTASACSETGEPVAESAAEEPGIIEVRKANFEDIGDAFKAIRGELERDTPDFAAISSAASELDAAAQKIEGHFPAGTGLDAGHDTEALVAIWEKPDEFAAAIAQMEEASEALVLAAASGEAGKVNEAIKQLGASCKECHDNFRLDKDD